MDKLSSTYSKEIFSVIAPIKAAINPIPNSVCKYPTLGVNKTTIHELTKNAKVPSRLFTKIVLPEFSADQGSHYIADYQYSKSGYKNYFRENKNTNKSG